MSVSRLIPPRLRSLINSVECRRWCSSVNNKGEISPLLKKSEVPEIFEKKHMTENERVFPREAHVQKEVGPWNNLVAILQITKKKIFGNLMEQNSSSTHELTSTSDLKGSDNVVSADSHGSGSMSNLKITIHSEKTSVANTDESKAFEVVNMNKTSNSAGPEELLNVSSKECEGSSDNSNGISSGVSSICGKASSNDGVQLINGFHRSELVEKEREQLLVEEVSSSVQISSGEDILSKFDSSCDSERVSSLVDVSQEKRNNEPELEAKNDKMQKKEVISDIISIFEKNGTSNLKQVTHFNSFLPSEATNKWRDVLVKKSVLSANEHHPAEDTSIPISLSKSEMDEIASVSNNSCHVEADHRATDQIVDPKSEKSVPREFEPLNGISHNIFGKSGDIKSLIDCIRELPPQKPSVVRPEEMDVDRDRERSANSSIQAQTDKQTLDRKKRKTSSEDVIGKKDNSNQEIACLMEKGELNKGESASLSEKLSDENKMTIKFVNVTAKESDVSKVFKGCGAVTKVVFPSVKSTNFKVAHVYFESEEGRQKALKKTDMMIKNMVALEATSPQKGRERMCIPNLIGCPEVPASLVKHPSRTVMIKKLNNNVSFHDIKEALSFCKSNITGIFFGSSSSVAYVEFETVEGKEIAIEKHSLIVLGERLSILRIDPPRTTIVRISNVDSLAMGKVTSVCKKLGKTRQFFPRTNDILDVHFKLAEWPRMLEILNRLNGVEVDGQQLVAKPAPVYPPDVLNVLWSQPEGRKHLKTAFNSMLLKLGEDNTSLAILVDNFYADVQER
ncbi:uncharacterized protein LOC132610769 isoform X1 [Lycium barbarum]|uniref:uncharacterized protein LOC132610769 isoform X1 n=2 Tax=Lycium barbarum TaxID=112863 RepID=UPI00293EFCFC|nr:uncharacterized protein LOC132610769 isoform X1 [Lycium barbarum]